MASVSLALLVLVSGFGPPSLVVSKDVRLYPWHLKLLVSEGPPDVPVESFYVIDRDTNEVLWAHNDSQRRPIASLTKIMTALVVVNTADLDRTIVVQASDIVEGSTMGLEIGDILTVEQLLWGLLLPSGNDAAVTLARVFGGSVEGFAELMNAQAAQLGMRNTNFANPHGLDDERNYSTAADVALMSQAAMEYPLFARIVSTPEIVIEANRRFELETTNELFDDAGLSGSVQGIKTGWTGAAGFSLVSAVELDGRRLLAVVLDADDRAADSTQLFNEAWQEFTWLQPSLSIVGFPSKRELDNPASLKIEPVDAVAVPTWARFFLKTTYLPAAGGDGDGAILGRVDFQVAGESVRIATATAH